jgi:DNA-binding CsgD family transcriptional regulator
LRIEEDFVPKNETDGAAVERRSGSLGDLADEVLNQYPSIQLVACGFLQAWSLVLYSSPLVLGAGDVSFGVVFCTSTLALALTLVAATRLWPRRPSLGRVPTLLGALLACVGSAALAVSGEAPVVTRGALAACTGVGTGLVHLQAIALYSRTLPRRGMLCYALAVVLGTACFFVVNAQPTPVATVLFCALPLASAALSTLDAPRGSLAAAPERVRFQVPHWRLFAAVFILSFVVNTDVHLSRVDALDVQGLSCLLRIVLAAGIAVYALHQSGAFRPVALLYPLSIVIVVYLSVAEFVGTYVLAFSVITDCLFSAFNLFVWCALCSLAYQLDDPQATNVFRMGYGAASVGAALGYLAGSTAAEHIADIPGLGLRLGLLLLVLLTVFAVFPEHRALHWFEPVDETGRSLDGSRENHARPWKERCRAVGQAYGLTERETEVLVLVSKGRSNDEIARALVVSAATVKTHRRNLYAKMGVHSKAEIDAIIETTA